MNSLINLIKMERDNRKTVFVFPSEAAAEFWRRESLQILNRAAVRNDRFLSWDSFKEKITSHERLEKPVNSVVRRLFAADIVRRNSSAGPLFVKLIPAEYCGQSGVFSETILRILPELKSLIDRLGSGGGFNDSLVGDYLLLYREYLDFLSRNGLFEPSWEFSQLNKLEMGYIVVFPELIEDFREYSAFLLSAGCRLHGRPERPAASLRLFENTVVETDAVLNRISDLLQGGTGAGSIVITSADEQASSLIISKARLRGIPIASRQGSPLADYPAGRLPELIRECRQSGFSIAALKGLLLFKAFNWKDRNLAALLVRFGIENRCLKNTASSVYGDVWAARLKAAKEIELLSFYRKLRKRIEAFTASRTFDELSAEFQVFVTTFLDTEAESWDSACEQVFQRTREVLGSLREIEAGLIDTAVSDPLGLWIEVLKEKVYVQQSSVPGVALYPYRVSAGIRPAYHFLIGLSHDSSNIVSKSFAFLTDQQRKQIDADELNMTEDFIDVYAVSGREIWISGSTETPGGVSLPPGRFIEDSSVDKITVGLAEYYNDPFYSETLWWEQAAERRLPFTSGLVLTPIQKEGFLYALDTYLGEGGFDASASSLPPGDLLEALITTMSDDEGLLRVSASALNRWSDCPFLYLLSDVLKVREDEYILKPEDPMTAGTIMHEILFEFFEELKARGEKFSSSKVEQYEAEIELKSEQVFQRWEKEENYFYGPAWDAQKRRAVKSLLLFPSAEAELYDGLLPTHLEQWLELIFDEQRIKAGGFIDRISTGNEGSVIIDYKKNWLKTTRAKFIQSDEEGVLMRPVSGYQLPFYLLLAEAEGLTEVAASYYSITAGRHYPVSGAFGVLSDEDVELLKNLTVSEIKKMAEAVRSGLFQAAERCGGCGLRGVCRKRFNIRWRG
ncbi:MAG: PD-(D/E)XK nuclease family protein [Spirochaetales bacterium]|nr:PD-(D/E)XK nuclease family protein [Spirochaetales bacterium]